MKDGTILHKQRFPSSNPRVTLWVITYACQGLKIKGMLAEPKEKGMYDGFLYLRGGIKNVGTVRPARLIQFASQGFIVMAPFYREIKEAKETKILQEMIVTMLLLLTIY